MSDRHQRPIAYPKPRLQSNTLRQHGAYGANKNAGANSSTYRGISEEETIQERRVRIEAAHILASYEQLVWAAMARNEGIVQTRLHYEAILAGLSPDDAPVAWPIEYPDVSKAKARVSSDSHSKARHAGGEAASSSRRKDSDHEKSTGRRSLGAS